MLADPRTLFAALGVTESDLCRFRKVHQPAGLVGPVGTNSRYPLSEHVQHGVMKGREARITALVEQERIDPDRDVYPEAWDHEVDVKLCYFRNERRCRRGLLVCHSSEPKYVATSRSSMRSR